MYLDNVVWSADTYSKSLIVEQTGEIHAKFIDTLLTHEMR